MIIMTATTVSVCAGEDLQKVIQNLQVINILDKATKDIKNLQLLSKDALRRSVEDKTGRTIPTSVKKDTLVHELQDLLTADEQVLFTFQTVRGPANDRCSVIICYSFLY